jgi:hypothetical protein
MEAVRSFATRGSRPCRRSQHLPAPDLGRPASVEAASNPTCRLPRAGDGPCQRGGCHPSVELVPRLPGSTNVVLVRRATTVRFTAVPAGPKRTVTDNATAASTCAILYRRRRQSCPIWLCKQVIGQCWQGVALPSRRSSPWSRRGPEYRRRPATTEPEPQWVRIGALEPAAREGIVTPSHHGPPSLAELAWPAISPDGRPRGR